MKTLSNYMQEKQTQLFNKTGAFFAFGDSQFEEKRQKNVIYVSLGAGLICPKDKAKYINEQLDKIYHDSINQDIEENGLEKIILRELFNYECFYTGNYTNAYENINSYPGITEELVATIFYANQSKYA